MKLRKNVLILLPAALFLGACGDDVTKVVSASRMESALREASLPECTSDLSGKILYVVESGAGYVCGNSGWIPLSASREKFSCDLEALEDSSGYKMICDGDSIGVVRNGANGANGALGGAGAAAENGDGCSIVEGDVGRYFQVCGTDTTLLYRALCNGEPFDIKINFCYEGRVFAKPVFDTLVDGRDSSVYRMVKIGNQEWMAEDLRFDYPESILNDPKRIVDSLFGPRDMQASKRRHRLFGDSAHALVLSQGRLYPWTTTPDSVRKTLCPAGTHLPSVAEWDSLLAFVVENGQGLSPTVSLRAKYGWLYTVFANDDINSRIRHAADLFGFSALPIAAQEYARDNDFTTSYGDIDGVEALYLLEEGNQVFALHSYQSGLGTPLGLVVDNVGTSYESRKKYRFVRCLRN